MNPLTTPSTHTAAADDDLAEQARPGHGIPSQDPNPDAQTLLDPQEAERESRSVLMGGGMVAGAAAGATGNPENSSRADPAAKDTVRLHIDEDFFSANGALLVTGSQREEAIALCNQSAQHAALACMDSFGSTDFREDLKKVTLPTLVIHGNADAIVPIESSGQRTHRAVLHSTLVKVDGAPHGLNVTHAQAFNHALLSFLRT